MSNNKDDTNNIDREDIMKAFFSQKKTDSKRILDANKISKINIENREEYFGLATESNRKLSKKFGMR